MTIKKRPTFVRAMTQVVVAGVLLAGVSPPGLAAVRAPLARHLPPPEHIAPQMQAELKARMSRHGDTMANLVRAVVLLDRPTIRALAGRIADEEIVARASKSPHEPLPLSLPRDFFVQQTKLAVAARELATAVVEGAEDAVVGERFAALTSTCIGCHSAYLHGQPDAEPWGPKPDGATPDGAKDAR